MAGEYKAACGCRIHVAQWTAKRKVVSQESCPLHKAAPDLLKALKRIRAVACGEEQVSRWEGEPLLECDTGGMQWIFRFAEKVLAQLVPQKVTGPNGECPHCGEMDCRCDKEHFL